MRLECGIYAPPQHTPMEMRILRTFSPWAKSALRMRHLTGYTNTPVLSSHFTTFSAHGLAGLGWAGWAG